MQGYADIVQPLPDHRVYGLFTVAEVLEKGESTEPLRSAKYQTAWCTSGDLWSFCRPLDPDPTVLPVCTYIDGAASGALLVGGQQSGAQALACQMVVHVSGAANDATKVTVTASNAPWITVGSNFPVTTGAGTSSTMNITGAVVGTTYTVAYVSDGATPTAGQRSFTMGPTSVGTLTATPGTPVNKITFAVSGATATTGMIDPGNGQSPVPITLTAGAGSVVYTYPQGGVYRALFTDNTGKPLASVVVTIPLTATPKTPNGASWQFAVPFVVTDGWTCDKFSDSDPSALALTRLEYSEERQVESAFWNGSAGNFPFLGEPGVTVLATAATPAVDVPTAVGMIEQAMGAAMGAAGVIHLPRALLGLLGTGYMIRQGDGHLMTPIGTKYVFGGGYDFSGPNGVVTPNVAWIYGTGPVIVRRGDPWVNETFQVTPANNQATAIAERPYLVTADCGVWAAAVTYKPTG